MRRHATDWGIIFAKNIFDKGLVSKIYKEFLELNNKKAKNSTKRWAKGFNKEYI